MNFLLPQRNQSTFKPRNKRSRVGDDVEPPFAKAHQTLGSGSLRDAVRLPEGEDVNEWIAVNIVDFFNQISMLYGTVVEHCTAVSCPRMTAGSKFEYYWSDTTKEPKKVHKCTAPQYIDYLMTWVQDQLDDENLFPSRIGVAFPSQFAPVAKAMMKRLFRVYAHLYHHHFGHIETLKEQPHLNTSFKHFMLFVCEFDMIEQRELEPLRQLIDSLVSTSSTPSSSASASAASVGK